MILCQRRHGVEITNKQGQSEGVGYRGCIRHSQAVVGKISSGYQQIEILGEIISPRENFLQKLRRSDCVNSLLTMNLDNI